MTEPDNNKAKIPEWIKILDQPKITSECSELATALAKAQAEIDAAPKSESNPFFKSTYADLAAVRAVIREPFGKHGLSVVQIPQTTDGYVHVTTVLFHSSGQCIHGTLTLKPTKNDPQGIGSAITYARRYALMAFAGVAPDDDDGNDASAKRQVDRTDHKPVTPPQTQRSEVRPPRENIHWQNLVMQLQKTGVSLDDKYHIIPEDKPLAREIVHYCTNEKVTLETAYKDPERCLEAVTKVADGNREFPPGTDNSLLSQVKEKLAEKVSA